MIDGKAGLSPNHDATALTVSTALAASRYREQAIHFHCAGEQLFGVVTLPQPVPGIDAATGLGVVIVVGGPQYRSGSHRQFVVMARAIAASGIPVLRFDYRGMGDSTGSPRSFETVDDDIASAIKALQVTVPTVRRVVLWGLCDGASAALMFCGRTPHQDVAGLCLLNPWVRSEASLAKTQVKHYYTQRLMQREFWLKLLRGGVALDSIRQLGKSVKSAVVRPPGSSATPIALPYPQLMAKAWKEFAGPILLVLCGNDFTAKEFLEFAASDSAWAGALNQGKVVRRNIDGADHTLSNSEDHRELEAICAKWLLEMR